MSSQSLGSKQSLSAAVARYREIYDDFLAQAAQFGLPFAENREEELAAQREELRELGITFRNNGASLVYGDISPACEACRKGLDSYTGLISLRCHRHCFFCFNPNQEEYDQLAGEKKDWRGELTLLHEQGAAFRFIALTGGEPLLHREEMLDFFRTAHAFWPDSSLRLYTSGDLMLREDLAALKEAGLEELRFSLKLDDEPDRQEKVWAAMETAREFIPRVMVEMPVLPGSGEEMRTILTRMEKLGVFGINLLELCFPFHNAEAFREKGYALRNPPYRTLYNFWYAGGLPVAGSEQEALTLLRWAAEQKLRLNVHYCSLENKHSGQIYQQNLGPLPKNGCYILSQRDFYLKTVKVFGKDMKPAEKLLKLKKRTDYRVDRENGFLQMTPDCAAALRESGLELAVSYNVRELREGQEVLRELRLDAVSAAAFDPAAL